MKRALPKKRPERRGSDSREAPAASSRASARGGAQQGSHGGWGLLGVILLVGLLVRASYLTELVHAPDFAAPAADAAFHDYWARSLARGDWTPPDGELNPRIPEVPFLRPPAYPYFLAAVYKLTGQSYLGARIVQMALGLMNCVLAFLLGRALFNRGVGLILAAFCAVYWAFVYFEGELQAPVLIITLSLLLMLTLWWWLRRPQGLRALVGGVLIGLLAMARANALLFIPVAAAWAWWAGRHRGLSRRRAALHAALLVLGSAAAVAPATIRNAVVAREFVPLSCNGAINLYIGNNETSDGVSAKIPDLFELTGLTGWSWFSYDQIVQGIARHEGREMKYSDVSRFFRERAFGYMIDDWQRCGSLCLKRALLFWGPVEISNNKAIAIDKRNSRTLRFIPTFPAMLSLSLVGLALLGIDAIRSRPGVAHRPLAGAHVGAALVLIGLFIATYFVSFIPFLAAGRFRVPLLPLVFLFGAYGVYRFGRFLACRLWGAAIGTLAAWGLLVLLCGGPGADREVDLAWWHTDRGTALAGQGRLDEALEEFAKALEANPGFVDAHIRYAEALADLGRTDEAIARFELGLRHRPDRHELRLRLGRLLVDAARYEQALPHLRRVIEAGRDTPQVHYYLGVALLHTRRHADAVEAFRRTVRRKGDHLEAHVNLGVALAGLGEYASAAESYRRAIEINPRFAPAHANLGNALRALKDDPGAVAAYERAIEIDPDYIDAIVNLGNVYNDRGEYESAIGLYQRAVSVDGRHILARCNLAGALANQQRYEEAAAELERALMIDPRHPLPRKMLEQLRPYLPSRQGDP